MDRERLNHWANRALARAGYSSQRSRDAKREVWWWWRARRAARPGRPLRAGRAVVWTQPGHCELLPVEVPGPAAGEALVEVAYSIVSTGTERAGYTGRTSPPPRYPARPGYSTAGVVVAAGRKAGVAIGDRVAAPLNHCSLGLVSTRSVYAVPSGVPLEDAAFTQLGIIARRGITLGELAPGESVCVVGCGVVGLLAARLAVASGAGRVTAVARSRRAEALARAGGAAEFVATEEEGDLDQVGAHLVIEATGDPQAFSLAVAAAGPGGRIALLGSPRGVTRGIPLDTIRSKRLSVVGAHISTLERGRDAGGEPTRDEALAFLDQLASKAVVVDDLVEETLDPRSAPAFYRRLARSASAPLARFDWTLLAERERNGRASRLAPPRIGARGVDFGTKPIEVPAALARELAGNPLDGASGDLRIGLVGCGDIGVQNAAAISAASNARLVAAFDPVARLAEEVSRAHGGDPVGTFDHLLERADVDAVFLAVPHDLHAPLALRAAETGRHVIVEKPPAQSLAAARELVDAAERHAVRITVCFPHRYEPAVAIARRLVAEGAVGDLQGTLTSLLMDKPPSYWHGGYSGRVASDWRFSRLRAGGGVLIMNLSHYVDLLLHLTGEPVREVSAVTSSVDPEAEVEDFVSASVRHRNGAVGTVVGGAAVPGTWEGSMSTGLHFWGSEGHMSLERTLEVFSLEPAAGLTSGRWHAFHELPRVPLRTAFVSRFASAVDRGEQPDVTLEESVAVQAVLEAAYRSAEEHRPVSVEDLPGGVVVHGAHAQAR